MQMIQTMSCTKMKTTNGHRNQIFDGNGYPAANLFQSKLLFGTVKVKLYHIYNNVYTCVYMIFATYKPEFIFFVS